MGYNYNYTPPKSEQQAAFASLTTTGMLPHDQYWTMVEERHDLAPHRFDSNHPQLAFILDRNAAQEHGLLSCNAPIVSNLVRERFALHPHNFAKYHSRWLVGLAKVDQYLQHHMIDCNLTQPVVMLPQEETMRSPGVVSSPTSFITLTIGLVCVSVWQRFAGRGK